ncbi:uncharacterized protein LOC114465321 [Gouania willdenowi]|uniref:uncharacterized protein LOC114465321 n=1 Tax=Gouania willdenowi TaxID=441366 RepID=UPI001055E359|nr:uncharacterized protein LOC114465321 [Gouania willdenowi]
MEASRRSSGLTLRIIEHLWAHRKMDLQVMDAYCWLDLDSLLLSLEDSGKLRVASALVYSITRRRDVARFDMVMAFLEATRRLFPGVVTAIKHMKIMFGIKTLVIMWMLREEERMIETVLKIIQFFPNKLPQYQHQCSHQEMFLMRRNHRDFKDFALVLALDKDRRHHYIQTQLQEQYGERYAQKVEERLLQYLHQLEAAQPADTYVDRIMKKNSPVTEDEKLLLDVITSDCTEITATLKNLLHCDATSCHSVTQGNAEMSPLSKSEVATKPSDVESVGFSGDEDRPSAVGRQQSFSESPDQDGISKRPHFCSRHQRWVTSILQECQDDGPKANVSSSSSPLLFSSASSASSQDLTPSGLVPSLTALPPQTDGHIPETEKTDEKPEDRLLSAVVRLVDISTHPNYKAFEAFTVYQNNQVGAPQDDQDRRRADGSSVMEQCCGWRDAGLRRKRTVSKLSQKESSSTGTQKARSSGSSGVLRHNANELIQTPPPPSTFVSSTSTSDPRVLRARLGSLVPTQVALGQPYVCVSRLSVEQCVRAMVPYTHPEPEEQEEQTDLSFDINELYSGSDGDDSLLREDPDYKPWMKKKRLLLEYENAKEHSWEHEET